MVALRRSQRRLHECRCCGKRGRRRCPAHRAVGDLRVDGRRLDLLVPEQLLHCPQVPLDGVGQCSEAVPHGVCRPAAAQRPADELAEIGRAEVPAWCAAGVAAMVGGEHPATRDEGEELAEGCHRPVHGAHGDPCPSPATTTRCSPGVGRRCAPRPALRGGCPSQRATAAPGVPVDRPLLLPPRGGRTVPVGVGHAPG